MHTSTPWVRFTLRLMLAVTPVFASGPRDALAQTSKNEAAAEALFQQGRALYEAGRYAEACPKLAESQRIDPATGTLLALALCHEGERKLASAWAEFTTVEGEARRAGRKDRETIAREHAAAIRPRLSTLLINVPPEVSALPGLELKLDGTTLGPASFGVTVPVDGGEHEISASAPGKRAWKDRVSVKTASHAVKVTVPPLDEAAQPAASEPRPSGPRPSEPVARAPERDAPSKSPRSTIGLIIAGTGLAAIGVGSYLALTAKADYDAAEERCPSQGCSQDDWEVGEAARRRGNVATIVFSVGGALAVTGGVLWLTAPKGEARRAGPVVERVGFGPNRLLVEGAF